MNARKNDDFFLRAEKKRTSVVLQISLDDAGTTKRRLCFSLSFYPSFFLSFYSILFPRPKECSVLFPWIIHVCFFDPYKAVEMDFHKRKKEKEKKKNNNEANWNESHAWEKRCTRKTLFCILTPKLTFYGQMDLKGKGREPRSVLILEVRALWIFHYRHYVKGEPKVCAL